MEELEKAKKTDKKTYDWLKPYQFKKGNPGGPGRPPGKSLKTWLREHFETLNDAEKMEFFKNIDPELAWKMAEGNPANNVDMTSGGEKLPNTIAVEFKKFNEDNT